MAKVSRKSPFRIDAFALLLRICAALILAAAVDSARAGDLRFVRRTLFDAPFTAPVYDIDGNGYAETLGTLNRGRTFPSAAPARLGLGAIFTPLATFRPTTMPFPFIRTTRDTRVADLDNDGRPDVVNNVYACNGDPDNATQLYLQQPDGTFALNQAFALIGPITGRGETIVASDFNNDGYLDLFIPQYTRADSFSDNFDECAAFLPNSAPAQSWLLRNLGAGSPGRFEVVPNTPVDLTLQHCGIDCANAGPPLERYAQPEGAQAIDYDEDGNIDLFVSGMLFRNSGEALFTRVWPPRGITPSFDEGLKFLDWNNDGYPDLATVDSNSGLVHLYTWAGGIRNASGQVVGGGLAELSDPIVVGTFAVNAVPGTYGMTVADMNGDGYEDIIVNGSVIDYMPKIYLNLGPPTYAFKRAAVDGLAWLRAGRNGPVAADLNYDGMADLLVTGRFGDRTTQVLYNATPRPSMQTLTIEVVGDASGLALRNQQGRVIHVLPQAAPSGFSYTRYIDGGSGYMAQTPYPVSVSSRYSGPHTVSVRLASRTLTCEVTPPAYLIMRDGSVPTCTVLPPPTALPVPHGHEVRALQGVVEMVLE